MWKFLAVVSHILTEHTSDWATISLQHVLVNLPIFLLLAFCWRVLQYFLADFMLTCPHALSTDMRSLPCVDEKDEYYCLYEIAIEESCDFKPFAMMKDCRFSCSFCSKWKTHIIFILLKLLFAKIFASKFKFVFPFCRILQYQ